MGFGNGKREKASENEEESLIAQLQTPN